MAEDSVSSASWTDAFPAPRTMAPILSREEALSGLSSAHLLTVDMRRTDYEGGAIKGSINLPVHSFYMNRRVLFDLCKRAGVKKVAFYCGTYDVESRCTRFGWVCSSHDVSAPWNHVSDAAFRELTSFYSVRSSNGRGPRCSAWFADYIAENGDSTVQSFTLAGGIKGWVKAGEPYTEQLDGYKSEYWKQFD